MIRKESFQMEPGLGGALEACLIWAAFCIWKKYPRGGLRGGKLSFGSRFRGSSLKDQSVTLLWARVEVGTQGHFGRRVCLRLSKTTSVTIREPKRKRKGLGAYNPTNDLKAF